MRKRTRVLSGIATLVALTLSVFGGVWASSICAPEMDMSAPAAQHGAMAGHDGMLGPAGHLPAAPTDAPRCPFGGIGVAGSCVAASLPASIVLQLAASPEAALSPVSAEAEPRLLLGTSLFHPPRA